MKEFKDHRSNFSTEILDKLRHFLEIGVEVNIKLSEDYPLVFECVDEQDNQFTILVAPRVDQE